MRKLLLKGGHNIWGISIGILCLESYYYKVPGHIKNARTFNFPVTYKVVKGATPHRIVNKADLSLTETFIEAAKELETEGVKAISGSCGFLILFQDDIANAVKIPVYVSSLIQIPMVYKMVGSKRKVGILVAKKESFCEKHLTAAGIEGIPICIAGMDNKREFCDVIIDRKKEDLDINRLEQEVMDEVKTLKLNNPDMGALVIECTDLPPFAHTIQEEINVPVFDIVTLTNMVYESISRMNYSIK